MKWVCILEDLEMLMTNVFVSFCVSHADVSIADLTSTVSCCKNNHALSLALTLAIFRVKDCKAYNNFWEVISCKISVPLSSYECLAYFR